MAAPLPDRMYRHRPSHPGGPSWHLQLDHATWRDAHHLRHASLHRPPHTHDVYHVVVVSRGSGSFIGANGPLAVRAPWLLLVSPGIAHSFQGAPGDDTIYSECTFTGSDQRGAPLRLAWPHLLAERFARPCPVLADAPCSALLAAELEALIADLVSCGDRADPAIDGLATGFLEHLLFILFRRLVAERQDALDPLAQARRLLDHQLADPPSLTALADAVGLSPKHLGRAFAQRYGAPPGRYRQMAAMQQAANLLRASEAPIADIAASLGFADPRYFIRLFGRTHGQTPGVFRRQQRDL